MRVSAFITSSALEPRFWLFTFLIALASWILFIRKRYRLPPMPHSLPIVGNMFSMPKNKSVFTFGKEWSDEIKEPVIRLRLGLVDVVMLNDEAALQEALCEKDEHFSGRPCSTVFKVTSGGWNDVAFSDISTQWKVRRRIMMAALRTFSVGDRYEERIQMVWKRVAHELDKRATQVPDQDTSNTPAPIAFDPSDIARLLIYNYMAAVCYGQQLEYDSADFKLIKDNFLGGQRFFGRRLLADMFPFLKMLPFDMPDVAQARYFFDNLRSYSIKQLDQHRKNFRLDDIRDFTDHMLRAKMQAETEENTKNLLSDDELTNVTINVFGAGQATQPSMLIWMFHLMAMHQDKQLKAYEEICTLLESDQQPCSRDRYRLIYCEACVNECIRFGTTIAPLPRKTMVDTQVGGYDIPKGTLVLTNHAAVHFDEKLWGDPHVFRPERFLVNGAIVKPNCFQPFGRGKRMCAGQSAAKSTLFLFFVLLIRRYKIVPPAGQEMKINFDIVLGTPNPFKIVLERREPLLV